MMEDVKSLDSNQGMLAEERSENNSFNSDIVHVEREDAEEEPELQESMLSVLGTESELAELRAEFREDNPPTVPAALQPVVAYVEVPVVLEMPAPLSAIPLEPEPRATSPVAEPALALEALPLPPTKVPPTPPPIEPEPEIFAESEPDSEPVAAPPTPEPVTEEPEFQSELEPSTVPLLQAPPAEEPPAQTNPESELPVLLYGGAVLVALAAVVAWGVLTHRKK